MIKPDLDSKERIAQFVDAFYQKILDDQQLAPIFLDVAEVDLSHHKPLICRYWEKLLLGDSEYNRHTMNIHRALNAKRELTAADFDRWLGLFCQAVDANFSGEKAERAKQVAGSIASNMLRSISQRRPKVS